MPTAGALAGSGAGTAPPARLSRGARRRSASPRRAWKPSSGASPRATATSVGCRLGCGGPTTGTSPVADTSTPSLAFALAEPLKGTSVNSAPCAPPARHSVTAWSAVVVSASPTARLRPASPGAQATAPATGCATFTRTVSAAVPACATMRVVPTASPSTVAVLSDAAVTVATAGSTLLQSTGPPTATGCARRAREARRQAQRRLRRDRPLLQRSRPAHDVERLRLRIRLRAAVRAAGQEERRDPRGARALCSLAHSIEGERGVGVPAGRRVHRAGGPASEYRPPGGIAPPPMLSCRPSAGMQTPHPPTGFRRHERSQAEARLPRHPRLLPRRAPPDPRARRAHEVGRVPGAAARAARRWR